jgi:hypothetical protein
MSLSIVYKKKKKCKKEWHMATKPLNTYKKYANPKAVKLRKNVSRILESIQSLGAAQIIYILPAPWLVFSASTLVSLADARKSSWRNTSMSHCWSSTKSCRKGLESLLQHP